MSLDLLTQIFEVCVLPLLGVLTAFLVAFIKRKTAEIVAKEDDEMKRKYIEMLSETIQEAVISTNQVYTDSLKAQGKFDQNAQEKAFAETYEKVMGILTEDAKKCLSEIYSDLEKYVTIKIEAAVRENKL